MLRSDNKRRYLSDQVSRWISVALATVAVLLVLAACGGNEEGSSPDQDTDREGSITIDQLPAGNGRGFPIAAIVDEPVPGSNIQVGATAPDFQLTTESGENVWLNDLQGRPVMINFWASWCGPCRIEMPDIVRRAGDDDDLVVLAVNVQEDQNRVQNFVEEFQMSMPVPLDSNGDVRDLYQVRGMPTSVFINRDGTVASTWAGLLTPDKLDELLKEILQQ